MAHNGSLWREEALAIAAHKPNVWLSLIGTSAAEYTMLFDDPVSPLDPNRCLFGSGWALADLDEQLAGWDLVDEDLQRQLLYDNAAELLGM